MARLVIGRRIVEVSDAQATALRIALSLDHPLDARLAALRRIEHPELLSFARGSSAPEIREAAEEILKR